MTAGDGRDDVALGLGSNLGDMVGHLRFALRALAADGAEVGAVSSLYDTPPWGVTDQPHFANAAALVRTTRGPLELLDLVKTIEADAGRDFSSARWSARPLDIDILLWGDRVIESERLTVPHALMHERAFVLEPLAEIAPAMRHPLLGKTVAQMLAALESDQRVGIRRREAAGWYE